MSVLTKTILTPLQATPNCTLSNIPRMPTFPLGEPHSSPASLSGILCHVSIGGGMKPCWWRMKPKLKHHHHSQQPPRARMTPRWPSCRITFGSGVWLMAAAASTSSKPLKETRLRMTVWPLPRLGQSPQGLPISGIADNEPARTLCTRKGTQNWFKPLSCRPKTCHQSSSIWQTFSGRSGQGTDDCASLQGHWVSNPPLRLVQRWRPPVFRPWPLHSKKKSAQMELFCQKLHVQDRPNMRSKYFISYIPHFHLYVT